MEPLRFATTGLRCTLNLVEGFAGTIALSAELSGEPPWPPPKPLIGYMGAKRVLAPAIAAAVGLARGQIEHFHCADAGPWGDVWAHFAEHGLAVAERFEAWASGGRELPALWRELVQHPPSADPVERLSQFLVLQSRTASASPIWWDEERWRQSRGDAMEAGTGWTMPDHATGRVMRAYETHSPACGWVMPSGHARDNRVFDATSRGRHSVEVLERGGVKAGPAHQAHSSQLGHPGDRLTCEKGTGRRSGIIDPNTIATRIRALHRALAHRLTAHHGDTHALLDLLPADLTGYVVYLDPPYVGCTPYAAACSREMVLELARVYRARGAIVVISEGEPMPLEGWHTVDLAAARATKRWTAKQKAEWLTMSHPPVKIPATQLTLWMTTNL